MALPRGPGGRLSSALARLSEDAGTVLIITVFGMAGVLAMLALVVDGSMIWVAQHQAQTAADAGALGAAQDLTGASSDTSQDTTAANDGTTVAQADDPDSSVQVTAPYNGDATTADVVVSKSVTLPFGFTATVKATADAQNNVVNNGSFNATFSSSWIEYCAADGITTSGPYASACPSMNPDMGSWTVYAGGVDLNNPSYITAPSGDPTAQSIDMEGSCSYDSATQTCTNNVNGEIYEPLNTVEGDTYNLSFDLSENPHGPPASKPMEVYISSYDPSSYGLEYAQNVVWLDGAAAGETWTPKSYTFVAPGAVTYLWFVSEVGCVAANVTPPNDSTSQASDCNNGAAITDVSVAGPLSDNLTR